MAKFRVHEYAKSVRDARFAMTGTVVEGEIKPGMFLRVWFSMMLYYPYRIVAVEPVGDAASGNVRLNFESEIGEECLLGEVDLRGDTLHVSKDEPSIED